MNQRHIVAAFFTIVLLVDWPFSAWAQPPTVNDITQLNPIVVEGIAVPKTVDEIRQLVREHKGPISIGGGRYSMGGQIATEQSLFIDMRELNRILKFSPEERTITVEAGITWRKIQEAIDPRNLSVKIMQSYANFTVGGSLSVNVHGRYVGQGPLIGSVQSIKVVLADGQLVEASPNKNPELFYGCIGGYGGLGIIVEATLELVDDQKVERTIEKLDVKEYKGFFFAHVRNSQTAVFHNGDIYPPAYDTVTAITWSITDRPVTVADRLMPVESQYWLDNLALFWISEMPFGQEFRAQILDPWRLSGHPIVWRNYEASYDVRQLEPGSRTHSTYVLQEYFVPVERFDEFVPKMAEIFNRYHVNIINVSIRHARQDPGSLLAWAKEECFAFVVYYKQGVQEYEKTEVGIWTRELIDAVLSVGGSYYLPYQIHATDEQFRRAYPRAEEFFALKSKMDPEYHFRNKLWDRYYPPPKTDESAKTTTRDQSSVTADAAQEQEEEDPEVKKKLHARKNYLRSEDQTYLTLPEWYIVYSADEFAAFLQQQPPSAFPYVRSVGQFWRIYQKVLDQTWNSSPFNWGYHLMIVVIGASYTAEYCLKGFYENTLGRLTEWLSPRDPWEPPTAEDRYIQAFAREYATFIHATPWYEFPFAQKLQEFWALSDASAGSVVRKWERRFAFTLELLFKTAWGWLIKQSSQAAYDPEDQMIQAWVKNGADAILGIDPGVRQHEPLDANTQLLSLPRYEPFTQAVTELANKGVRFVEIAGNTKILMTVIAPLEWQDTQGRGDRLLEWRILTQPDKKRVALTVDVSRLHEVIPSLEREQVTIDHLYDF